MSGTRSRGLEFLLPEAAPACAGEDPETFFPPQNAPADDALAVCARCDLCDRCRAWALTQNADTLFGVWGGTTQEDRREAQGRRR